jgi:hypothetical protein
MASTYSNTGIELIGVGEQANTWGQTTNTNWRLMEELVSGVIDISLNGLTSYTLTTVDGLTSNGRHMVVRFTGTPGGPVTVTVSPNEMQKVYLINNETTEAVTVAQGSGDTVEVAASSKKIIYCDGEGATASVQDMFSGEFSGDFSGDFSGNFSGDFDGDFSGTGTFSGTGDFTSFSLDGTEVTISATEINESITAAGTSYDNTDSEADATNAQAAFDEIFNIISNLDFSADAISYDDTASGYVATNVQDAIDETVDRLRNETYAVKQDVQSVSTSNNANRVFFEVTNFSSALSITIPSNRSDSEIEITVIIAFEATHTAENDCGVEFALTESTEEGGESTITAIARANYEYELDGASSASNDLKGTATLRARLSPGDGTHTYKIFARNRRAFGTQTVNIQGSTTEQNSTVVIRELV